MEKFELVFCINTTLKTKKHSYNSITYHKTLTFRRNSLNLNFKYATPFFFTFSRLRHYIATLYLID